MTIKTSRRSFLKSIAASTAVLAIGFDVNGVLAKSSDSEQITPFITLGADGKVTAIIKHFEKGQGTATGLSSLIAEELNMRLQDIAFEMAPSDPTRYNNLLFGPFQGTGGSTALANSFIQYRTAGAAVREMLLEAAAKTWGVSASDLTLKDSVISGTGKSGSIGDFIEAASQLPVPEKPKLKDPSEWTVIGNPQKARKDTKDKINGSGIYAMDLQLDDQLVVAMKRTPRFGGLVKSFDDSAAKEIKGFVRAATLPNNAGVVAYATSTWAAFQARDALEIEWDFSKAESRNSDQIKEELLAAVSSDAQFDVSSEADLNDTLAAIKGAAKVIEKDFYFPLLAHAPMEPLTACIEAQADGGVILHDGCQSPTGAHNALAQVLQLPMEKIQINTLYAGGSFGRRTTPTADYHVEVALAFAMTDRKRPVKLVWSREDDITGGYYRPAFAHKVRVGLDENGKIVGWDHRIAGQSLFKGTFFESFIVKNNIDHSSVEGVADTPYAIPGMHVGLTDAKPSTSVVWWRSVGHSHTAYVMEVMMDMAARSAGKDPVAYRLDYLSGEDASQKRMAGVLKLVADKAGWKGSVAKDRYHGVAVHKSFGSYVAEICEISKAEDGSIKIEKVSAAVDCGVPVNPDVIAAQMEGGIGYGIGHIMRDEITLEDGAVAQSNFPDYEPLRMRDIAQIETHVTLSAEAPTGVGEPGTPPAGPALANAIAAATDNYVTHLPMTKSGVTFA
jgi:isoquinoline 1-oxidoreductase beta subunit